MTKKVVIAGFGDTGLLVAAHLKKTYNITAISTKPCLVSGQELGARLTKPEAWKDFYLMDFERVKNLEGATIIQGKVTGIDPSDNCLTYSDNNGTHKLDYDALVIASGTRNGFWRTDDVRNQSEIEAELRSHADKLAKAKTIAIIGGGPTAVSVASNIKDQHPDKEVHLCFRHAEILRGYHPKTRTAVTKKLTEQGVNRHPKHEAKLPDMRPLPILENGTVEFTDQPSISADCILWATGLIEPNNDFIPDEMLDDDGYVKVDAHLKVPDQDNIFAIGDIAASDPNRSSARNMGYQLLAANIDKYLSGHPGKMKTFKAPKHRWGSVIGIQNEGLRIFTPKGGNVKITPWWVRHVLFPVFVHKMIYRGFNKCS